MVSITILEDDTRLPPLWILNVLRIELEAVPKVVNTANAMDFGLKTKR